MCSWPVCGHVRAHTTAVAENRSALLTVDYLGERAVRGDRGAFDLVLAKVPDVPVDAPDRL